MSHPASGAMTFGRAVATCLRKFSTFSGRARRAEYWWFALFLFAGSVVAGLLDAALFGITVVRTGEDAIAAQSDGPVALIFALAMLVPSLAAGWRRMHDTGRPGIYLLYPLIVMVGIGLFAGFMAGFEPFLAGDFGALVEGGGAVVLALALLVFLLSPLVVLFWLTRPSEDGPNPWGPKPGARP